MTNSKWWLLPVCSLVLAAVFCTPTLATDDQSDPSSEMFVRGDFNGNGAVAIRDVMATLYYLFADGDHPQCQKAADSNDDGTVSIADALNTLQYLFRGGDMPPAPFPSAGLDPTPDDLTCADSDVEPDTAGVYTLSWNGISCITDPCADLTARGAAGEFTIAILDLSALDLSPLEEARVVELIYRSALIVSGYVDLGADGIDDDNTFVVEEVIEPAID